jgi:hypothetical protein
MESESISDHPKFPVSDTNYAHRKLLLKPMVSGAVSAGRKAKVSGVPKPLPITKESVTASGGAKQKVSTTMPGGPKQ